MTKETESDEWNMVRNRIKKRIIELSDGTPKSMMEDIRDSDIVRELQSILSFMDAIA
jgi:hypothetical protein